MSFRITQKFFDDTDVLSGLIENGAKPEPTQGSPSSPLAAPSASVTTAAGAGQETPAAEGDASGGPPGTAATASASPFVINLNWDASVSSAPAAFKTGVQAAALYLESQFTDAVTINLNIGYGEVGGSSMGSLIGSTQAFLTSVSYAGLTSALTSDAKSAADTTGVASLPGSNPNGGNYWVSTAQAKALGLLGAATGATDANIGFSSTAAFTYDDSGGVAAGSYDFMGVALHELTEAMGRMLFTGETIGGKANSFGALDLFHFSAAGTHDYSAATPGYFSADNGTTDLADFNTVSGFDAGDWSSAVTDDAFGAILAPGVINSVSNADLTAVDLIGWDRAASTAAPDHVSLAPATGSLATLQGSNGLTAGTSLATITQAGGLSADSYSFALGGAGAASFALSTAGNTATLATGASTVAGAAGGKLYALTLTATDTTSGLSASASAVAVVAGGSSDDAETLSTLTSGLSAATPVFAYGLAGDDTMNGSGMTGKLWLDGGAGADTMTGGSGATFYLYGATADSTGSSMDIVTNFNVATDVLDLTGLGITLTDVGLIGSSTTTIAAGSVGWQNSGGNTFLYVNTGTKNSKLTSADMKIELQGTVALSSGNVLTFGSSEDSTAPGAPTITAVTDDVAPVIGALSDGGSTNDPNPTVSVGLSATGAAAGNTVRLYNGTGTGSALGIAYTLTAADITAGSANVQTGTLVDGTTYAITARITDQATNQSVASGNFTVTEDTTPPLIAIDAISGDGRVNGSEAAAGFSVSGTTDAGDGQTVTVRIVDGSNQTDDSYAVAASGGVWSASVTPSQATALGLGDYSVHAEVSDAAGNLAVEAVRDFSVVVCYARGTRLAVPGGEARVEDLRPGDPIIATLGSERFERAIKWVGWRRIDLTRHPDPDTVDPVRIRRGAFGANMPHRDLLVSPAHGVLADGKLICAIQLVNGSTIERETGWAAVEYFHVELETHELLIAEGLPAESYLDTGNRGFFANGEEPLVLHPDLIDLSGFATRAASSRVPFVCDEDSVLPVWRGLADRAASLGRPVVTGACTGEPDLRLDVNGRVLRPLSVENGLHAFILPRGTGEVRLVSRAGAPTDVQPWRSDRRGLGVAVRRMARRSAAGDEEIPVDHSSLSHGWWEVEQSGTGLHRWTDGDAVLPLPVLDQPSVLEIQAGNGGMSYLLEPRADGRATRGTVRRNNE